MELEPSLAVATFAEAAYTFAEVRVASFVEGACTFAEEMATFASMEVKACIGVVHLSLLEDHIAKAGSCTVEVLLPSRVILNCKVAFYQILIYYFDN